MSDLDVALDALTTAVKGGPGSGNFGHAGRPGQIGGSARGSMGRPSSAPVPDAEAVARTRGLLTGKALEGDDALRQKIAEAYVRKDWRSDKTIKKIVVQRISGSPLEQASGRGLHAAAFSKAGREAVLAVHFVEPSPTLGKYMNVRVEL